MGVRNEARIFTTIWADPTFRALSGNAQRLYLALLSQPNLGFSGILPTTKGRWATQARDLSVTTISRAMKELASADALIVVDENAEETLLRSFVRLDGVWKQPKMLRIALDEATSCGSDSIRRAIGRELARCDPSELNDKPREVRGQPYPSVQQEVRDLLRHGMEALLDPADRQAPPEAPPQAPPEAPRQAPRHAPPDAPT